MPVSMSEPSNTSSPPLETNAAEGELEMDAETGIGGPEEAEYDIEEWIGVFNGQIVEFEERARIQAVNMRLVLQKILEIEQLRKLEMEESLNAAEMQEDSYPDSSFDEEKISPSAIRLISQIEGLLRPDKFKEFLLEKSFNKPRPSVLPIVRGYDTDIRGVIAQLQEFKRTLKRTHQEYMIRDRKKDENLERRIERLVKNIEKELETEERVGLKQTSLPQHFARIQERNPQ